MASAPAEASDAARDSSAPSSSSQSSSGVMRWIWSGIVGILFGRRNVDFEKRLQHLSKEEVTVHTRLKRRAHRWRRLARAIVLYSVIIEVLVLGLALIYTRSPDLPWDIRALRVLPVFVVPAVAGLVYSACARYNNMRDRKDQRTLEKLRTERQARIDELKQRTNYYATQELIQRYDLDPTAKAAAASVLAAKLGAESGLNVAFKSAEGAESSNTAANVRMPEGIGSAGLRHRKPQQTPPPREAFEQQGFLKALEDEVKGEREREALERDAAMDRARGRVGNGVGGTGGWMARIAAMLVGEDPSQCYALICRNCHMHNGLAPKEDFQYITYICPHCHTVNGSQQLRKAEGNDSPKQAESPTSPVVAAANSSFSPQVDVPGAAKDSQSSSSFCTANTAESEIADG